MNKFLLTLPLVLFVTVSYAQDVMNTREITTQTLNTAVNNTIVGNPKDWGLTENEWAHYQQLMQGMSAHWYPNLTPPEILGMNAQNVEEQAHFAELAAKQEHDKLSRELSFDKAFHEATLRLYVDEPIIKPFDLSPFNPIQKSHHDDTHSLQRGDHLALFVDTVNDVGFVVLPHLITEIQNNKGVELDIYCLGNMDDNAIRAWAKLNNIPMNLVAAGNITLNHGNDKFQKMVGNKPLPYLLLIRNGLAQPLSIWSLT